MTTPINILMVEDSPEDTLLLLNRLKSAGFEPQWKRVQTEPDYLAKTEAGAGSEAFWELLSFTPDPRDGPAHRTF